MEWTSDGIKIWNFPRGDEPSDIASQTPTPSKWNTQYLKAAWSSHSCDTKKFFQQHAITFDITLCGDWAGSAYRTYLSPASIEYQGAPYLTPLSFTAGGKSKCSDYVKTGSHFTEAYWAINHVSVYQQ